MQNKTGIKLCASPCVLDSLLHESYDNNNTKKSLEAHLHFDLLSRTNISIYQRHEKTIDLANEQFSKLVHQKSVEMYP